MERVKIQYSDGTHWIFEGEWKPDTFERLQKGGQIIALDGEHPSTWRMTYEEIINEMSSIGACKNAIDKEITKVKLIREAKYKN